MIICLADHILPIRPTNEFRNSILKKYKTNLSMSSLPNIIKCQTKKIKSNPYKLRDETKKKIKRTMMTIFERYNLLPKRANPMEITEKDLITTNDLFNKMHIMLSPSLCNPQSKPIPHNNNIQDKKLLNFCKPELSISSKIIKESALKKYTEEIANGKSFDNFANCNSRIPRRSVHFRKRNRAESLFLIRKKEINLKHKEEQSEQEFSISLKKIPNEPIIQNETPETTMKKQIIKRNVENMFSKIKTIFKNLPKKSAEKAIKNLLNPGNEKKKLRSTENDAKKRGSFLYKLFHMLKKGC